MPANTTFRLPTSSDAEILIALEEIAADLGQFAEQCPVMVNFMQGYSPGLTIPLSLIQSECVTSDGGLILVRELDERLGLGKLIGEHLSDSLKGTNKQFRFADLLRQSVYSRLAGYEDLNDAARVSAARLFV